MTDKTPRTLDQINQEYTALCAQAGEKAYRVEQGKKDLEALLSSIRDINTEAAKSKQFYDALAAEKSKEAPAATVTPINEATANA